MLSKKEYLTFTRPIEKFMILTEGLQSIVIEKNWLLFLGRYDMNNGKTNIKFSITLM